MLKFRTNKRKKPSSNHRIPLLFLLQQMPYKKDAVEISFNRPKNL